MKYRSQKIAMNKEMQFIESNKNEYEIIVFVEEKRLVKLWWNDKSYKYVDNGDKLEMQRHASILQHLPSLGNS